MQPGIDGRLDRGARTRSRLVAEARKLFAAEGYANVSAERVLIAAGVTRGALYHHFADKQALFEAVFEATCADVAARTLAGADAPNAVEGLLAGCVAFLRACAEPGITRIYLVDGLSVLGFARWWEIDLDHALGALRRGVEGACAERGIEEPRQVDGLFTLLSGAVNQAGLAVGTADDPTARAAELEPSLAYMIRTVFGPAAPASPALGQAQGSA